MSRAAARGIDAVAGALASFSDGPPLNLLVGTPRFDPPEVLLESLRRAADEPHFGYTSNQGTLEVREAIAALHASRGETVAPEAVFVTHGAKPAVLALMGTLTGPGDEIVLPSPCYPPYLTIPPLFGARVVTVPRVGPSFDFDVDAIQDAITERTRAVVIASPCNPTGAVLSPDALRTLRGRCRESGIRLILDEAYEAFHFGKAPEPLDGIDDVACHVRSVSKSYALCGWRTGYVLAAPELVQRLTWFQAANLNPPNALMQGALEAMPRVPESYAREVRDRVRSQHDAVAEALAGTPIQGRRPAGGFYQLVDLRPAMEATGFATALELCQALASREGVALWPGEDYLAEGWARISVASLEHPEQAAELRTRILRFLEHTRARS